ncbi:serine/threonine protein phosphatase, putative [Trichomonas vaginalis G3]|uniref:protein-serine/threonine phosphatase n=1 Tax=Trichomonas vaginalis (strain ATCC PRA-98 / G3) TaxID=412133 RepID=A2FV07_TRIV3|nr:metallo-dependent phosphatases family [Trichomonas vaginalis G3]EAX91269.1 serine/threonine protein phosphatase, putative [Trichomonas vaginalis G3]KAI5491806.1 metallo-dependent phosphatases family [Trichomonas vaginalis G3]|eukprot:XP_001304199.1 serine/threonine protein phosphatase [Trichomonas vaginalis G3]
MNALGPSLQALLQEHILLMSFPVEKYSTSEVPFNPPFITPSLLIQILKLATQKFQEDPIVLNIKTPIYVIGDLHGHLFDLYRIFQKNGLPPEASYLF